jgi:hypothetical protein
VVVGTGIDGFLELIGTVGITGVRGDVHHIEVC